MLYARMNLHLLLFVLTIKSVLPYVRKPLCHACFDGICYSKSLIFGNHTITGQIAVERGGNILHFHYKYGKKDYTEAFDLNEVRFLNIPDIESSFARAVDQSTREVYIGGTKGIFKYNITSNTTTRVGLFDKTIWHMQYQDKIYYKEFMKKGLYTFSNKQSKSIAPLSDYNIEDFVIDKLGDIYFMTNVSHVDYVIYRLKKGEKTPTLFADIPYLLATDINDSAFFVQSTNRGMYKIDYRDGSLIEIGAFSNGLPVKIVFDNFNNVIYYDKDSSKLFYLTPNYGRCKVRSTGKGNKMKKMVSSAFNERFDRNSVLKVCKLITILQWFLNIPDIESSFARAVDQSTREVYIGGTKGIFKYNITSNTTTRVGLFDKTIWHMQYQDKIYYKEFMKKGLYTFSNKQSKSIAPLSDYNIEDFVIDKLGDIYFMTNISDVDYVIYRLKKGEKTPTLFADIPYLLATDINDSAFFVQSTNRGMYKIDYRDGSLIEIGAFSNGLPVKIVFDNFNNVIYYDKDSSKLFYLTPNYGRCKVRSTGKGNKMKKMVSSAFNERFDRNSVLKGTLSPNILTGFRNEHSNAVE